MKRLKNYSVLGALGVIILVVSSTKPVFAQQSTTGPIPPPGLDRGLHLAAMAPVVISGVPDYIWRHGCGPTAVGMVVGYWDGQGCPKLVSGYASNQTTAVNAMIADDRRKTSCAEPDGDHYQDYSCPKDYAPDPIQPDRSQTGGAHASNCVADFMRTSWSSAWNYYGWSWDSDVTGSFVSYVNMIEPLYEPVATNKTFSEFTWEAYKAEIDSGCPVVLLVDTDGDGGTDHFVTGIGYDDATMQYGIYDTWDHNTHWYSWRQIAPGRIWGIYSITTFRVTIRCTAKPGDANASGSYTLVDIIATVNLIFGKPGWPTDKCTSNTPLCWVSDLLCRGDWDADGNPSLVDVIKGVNYLFNKPGGPWNALPSGVCCLD